MSKMSLYITIMKFKFKRVDNTFSTKKIGEIPVAKEQKK
jgi:hypothetical protein